MQKIIAPLRPGDQGDAVANLQDALRLLVERGHIRPDRAERASLLDALGQERSERVYAGATARLVTLFRIQHGLDDLDWVDDAAAEALNKLLQELGVLDEERPCVVRGQITFASEQPSSGFLVRVYDVDLRSKELLGQVTTDADGRYELRYGPDQFRRAEKGTADLQVSVCHPRGRELAKSDIGFNAPAEVAIDLQLPAVEPGVSEYELYLAELEPVLQDLPLAELKEDQEH